MAYTIVESERVFSDPFIDGTDMAVGLVGMVLVLESVRRTVGLPITIVILLFLAFGLWGNHVPFELIQHAGLSLRGLVSAIFFNTDGVFGTPIGVSATLIVAIMLLGAYLNHSGGAELFMNVAKSLAGRFIGGSAKIAVVGSALFGMISGSTAANVATTGSVTIPMMKRAGYDPRVAGAVEALASSGGQIMPPIMGAAAFIMADMLNVSYGEVVYHAIVPALLYFLSIFLMVHYHAAKMGLAAIPKAEIPDFLTEMKTRGHMFAPVVVLVVLMANGFSTLYAAFLSVVSAAAVSLLRRATRPDAGRLYAIASEAMVGMGPIVAICAGAGILIGVLTGTGLNLKITYLIDYLAQGTLIGTLVLTMIACLILGMGLPTVAAYLVLATLVPASLVKLGIPAVAAHFFIFYFAILSAITPPVCVGAYVAAGIAKADPMQTGYVSVRMGLVAFLLPFAFIYDPALLLLGTPEEILLHVVTCVVGIFCWAVAFEGHFRAPLNAAQRIALVVAGPLLIWPELWLSALGFAIGAAALAHAWLQERIGVPRRAKAE
jgi:TRAP transporter 4TM/12TM fusion protein